MKPNFKIRNQGIKVSSETHQNNFEIKNNQKSNCQTLDPLEESIVGERQFIYFDNQSVLNESSMKINPIQQNISLAGTTQKIYFANASTLNRQQLQKNHNLKKQLDAIQPSGKVIGESQNLEINEQTALNSNLQQASQLGGSQDENEFLALNHVGKWQKGNKSNLVSEELKKLNSHLENRLTQTKWIKNKMHAEHTSKTEKNNSTSKNESSLKLSTINNSIKVIHNKKQQKQLTNIEKSTNFNKEIQKFRESISQEDQSKLSQMTSWKMPENKQAQDDQEEDEESQEDEEQSQQEQEQSDSQQQQEEEQDLDDEQEGEQSGEDQSSGEEGWDEPEDQEPQQQLEDQKQDPFEIPQKLVSPEMQAAKWSPKQNKKHQQSEVDTNKTSDATNLSTNQKNNFQIQTHNEREDQEHIQDLTEGSIDNKQADPSWEKLEKILLRIQKLVN